MCYSIKFLTAAFWKRLGRGQSGQVKFVFRIWRYLRMIPHMWFLDIVQDVVQHFKQKSIFRTRGVHTSTNQPRPSTIRESQCVLPELVVLDVRPALLSFFLPQPCRFGFCFLSLFLFLRFQFRHPLNGLRHALRFFSPSLLAERVHSSS